VGLPVEVLDGGPVLLGLGEDEDVLERAELAVCVFEDVMLRVAVAVDVSVFERRPVIVAAAEEEDVFEVAPVAVKNPVGRTDFVDVELGDSRRVPISERVDVVVFVDVLDCVEVDVGTRPVTSRPRS